MRVVFDGKRKFWKVATEGKIHSLRNNDFLVLMGLMDREDRKFHNVSELTIASKLEDKVLLRGLENLSKTSLIRSKGRAYRISSIGERVVGMIRRNEVEVINEMGAPINVRRLLGFEAK